MEKKYITWEMIRDRMQIFVLSKYKRTVKAYGVPRGGVALASMLYPVDTPEEAEIIIDDLIDSGATRDAWQKRFPDKEFIALCDKQTEPALAGKWLVFPWEENEHENEPAQHFARILQFLGQDLTAEGLKDTPRRFIKYMTEFLSPQDFDFTTFENRFYDEMIVEKNIPFYSLCEHHTLPFFGVAHIGYIPNGRIAGLSKIARTVQFFSAGLRTQEFLTQSIATYLRNRLGTEHVAVVMQGRHMCMEMRGAKVHNTVTTTSQMKGYFMDRQATREEFLNLIK